MKWKQISGPKVKISKNGTFIVPKLNHDKVLTFLVLALTKKDKIVDLIVLAKDPK